jgi:3-oxoacyl-[acyl-carrier-protein] synthase-3
MTSILDYEDRATCVLFGDGAGGVLLEPSQDENYIIDSLLFTDGSGGKYLCLPGGGSMHPATEKTVRERMHFVKQDGKKVFKFAVIGMADISSDILKKHGLTGNDIKLFIPHQANKRIIDACVKRLGLSPDQVLINIDKYANTTGATIAIGLAEAVEEGRVQTGDYILLAAFGAGFTWGSTLIRWGTTY